MYTYKIVYDQDAEDPRMAFSNLGTMACWHRRYTLGDEQPSESPDEWLEAFNKDHPRAVILPVYLYDHTGITIRTHPFSCPWDSGQVGWIYITKEKILEEFEWKVLTKKRITKVENYLRDEVDTYAQYLEGDTWGYVIYDENGDDVDSCFGFYGQDTAEEAAKEQINYLLSSFGGDS